MHILSSSVFFTAAVLGCAQRRIKIHAPLAARRDLYLLRDLCAEYGKDLVSAGDDGQIFPDTCSDFPIRQKFFQRLFPSAERGEHVPFPPRPYDAAVRKGVRIRHERTRARPFAHRHTGIAEAERPRGKGDLLHTYGRRQIEGDLIVFARRFQPLREGDAAAALQRTQLCRFRKICRSVVPHEPRTFHGEQAGAGKERLRKGDGHIHRPVLRAHGSAGERGKILLIRGDALRKRNQMFRRPVDRLLERGQHAAAQAVARKTLVRIALVLRIRQRKLRHVPVDLCPRHAKQRTRDPLPFGKDVHARGRRPPRKTEEDGLRVIVPVVRRKDDVRLPRRKHFFKTRVPPFARRLLQPRPPFRRERGNGRTEYAQRHFPRRAKLLHEGKIAHGSLAADPVFTGHGAQRHAVRGGMFFHVVQKAHGVAPARERHADALPRIRLHAEEIHTAPV